MRNWFHVLSFVVFFLMPCAGVVWGAVIGSGILTAMMAVMALISLYAFVIPDVKAFLKARK
jgi:hypothetical protein